MRPWSEDAARDDMSLAGTARRPWSGSWSRCAVPVRDGFALRCSPDARGDTLAAWVRALVAAGAIVHTDGWKGYNGLVGVRYDHRPRLQRRDHPDAQKLLPRAHPAASNLKTWLQGSHRGVSPEHLQVYLDEFVFRHNRRRTRWPPSRPCSDSARCTSRPPIARSPAELQCLSRSRPDSHVWH
jgi:transposase-like protein